MQIHTVHAMILNKLSSLYQKDEASTIAWWLLEALTQQSRIQLIAHNSVCSPEQLATINRWLDEHIHQHKPLAYIIGSVPFCDLTIMTHPPLLIPRPETEEWVQTFITNLKEKNISNFVLLDLCSGTGCIALAVAHAFPQATIIALDIDPQAIACARTNAAINKITNITFIESDLFEALQGQSFDFIVSNPPYIAHDEKLDPSITMWEAQHALFADDKGYAIIKRIIAQAHTYLHTTNMDPAIPNLWIEIGYRQADAISAYMKEHGYDYVHCIKDYAGHDRVLCGRYVRERNTTHNS